MHGTYLQNKQSIYNYREKNRAKVLLCRRNAYLWKKIQKVFFHILLEN